MAGEFGKFIDEKRRGRGPDGGDILLKDIAKAMGATPTYLSDMVVSRFFCKFISSASKYRHQTYGFSSSAGCSISILNRSSMSI